MSRSSRSIYIDARVFGSLARGEWRVECPARADAVAGNSLTRVWALVDGIVFCVARVSGVYSCLGEFL